MMAQQTATRKSNKLTDRQWVRDGKITVIREGKTVFFFVWNAEQWLRLSEAHKSLVREFGANFDDVKIFVNGEWWGHHNLKPVPERQRKFTAHQQQTK
ncbi:MAG: hypothetical protein KME43_11310 [Myxacorys chilensis ATA2-1-KO14]|jgi:hypothetical protein|nr:hypothetical protein [Myxacorys chilensis ATA2-1-KO14]